MPYASIAELLLVDPKRAEVRARLRATALEPSLPANVRFVALNRLELAPTRADAVSAATALATSVADETSEQRWLVQNAIATLWRAETDESRRVLASLAQSTSEFKRDAVRVLGSPSEGRAQ